MLRYDKLQMLEVRLIYDGGVHSQMREPLVIRNMSSSSKPSRKCDGPVYLHSFIAEDPSQCNARESCLVSR